MWVEWILWNQWIGELRTPILKPFKRTWEDGANKSPQFHHPPFPFHQIPPFSSFAHRPLVIHQILSHQQKFNVQKLGPKKLQIFGQKSAQKGRQKWNGKFGANLSNFWKAKKRKKGKSAGFELKHTKMDDQFFAWKNGLNLEWIFFILFEAQRKRPKRRIWPPEPEFGHTEKWMSVEEGQRSLRNFAILRGKRGGGKNNEKY